jgi:hypothetical protein
LAPNSMGYNNWFHLIMLDFLFKLFAYNLTFEYDVTYD